MRTTGELYYEDPGQGDRLTELKRRNQQANVINQPPTIHIGNSRESEEGIEERRSSSATSSSIRKYQTPRSYQTRPKLKYNSQHGYAAKTVANTTAISVEDDMNYVDFIEQKMNNPKRHEDTLYDPTAAGAFFDQKAQFQKFFDEAASEKSIDCFPTMQRKRSIRKKKRRKTDDERDIEAAITLTKELQKEEDEANERYKRVAKHRAKCRRRLHNQTRKRATMEQALYQSKQADKYKEQDDEGQSRRPASTLHIERTRAAENRLIRQQLQREQTRAALLQRKYDREVLEGSIKTSFMKSKYIKHLETLQAEEEAYQQARELSEEDERSMREMRLFRKFHPLKEQ